MRWIWISSLSILFLGVTYLVPVDSKPVHTVRVEYEISADGPAIFYSVFENERKELWRVDCTLPLRNCVARGRGLIVSLDDKSRPWMMAARPRDARISIQSLNYSIDMPNILNQPLNRDTIALLSKYRSYVVIEENDKVLLRAHSYALDQLLDYLIWVHSPVARTTRDARLWPDFSVSDQGDTHLSSEAMERYQAMHTRGYEQIDHGVRRLIPATKPQVEFAIKAQNGFSFFSNRGRAGY